MRVASLPPGIHILITARLVRPLVIPIRGEVLEEAKLWPVGWIAFAPARRGTSRATMALGSASIAVLICGGAMTAAADKFDDLRRIGLQPLYEALVAVANCPDVTIDAPRFRSVAAHYHLAPEDLTLGGSFGPDIAGLARLYQTRVNDDRGAFCSSARLRYTIDGGVLRTTGRPALR